MNDLDYILHGATLNQIPSGEFFPLEGIKTNVVGIDNELRVSVTISENHQLLD